MGRSLLVERALLALLLVVLAPVECGAGPWWGGHRGTRGYGAAGLAGGGGGPNVRSPRITRLEPPKGHVSGGTTLTIRGRGFVRSADLRVRFADENAVDEVRGTWVSSVEVTCVTPARPKPATTQVTVSNGDGSWSAPPLVYVAGSGTALTFTYDDSPPGCQGCAAPGGFQAALSPWERARERWESDRDSGPDSGGTTVHISSANGGMRLNPGVGNTAAPSPPSPPTPPTASVPTPELHLVADDVTDVDSSNLIQSWSDHNGNGLSLSAFVGKPELVDGDGAMFNGHRAVRFGKTGITGLSLPTSALQLSTSLEGMTVVAVVRSLEESEVLLQANEVAFFWLDRGFVGDNGFGISHRTGFTLMYSATRHGGVATSQDPQLEYGSVYVVTAQWKFAKSGVSGYQLTTSQRGNLSNPDIIPVTAHTWTGTGVNYNNPFVIGTQSKSHKRNEWRWMNGHMAEFRYYLQVLDQDEVTAIQDELLDKYQEWCDASVPPTNGGVGDCPDKLTRGTTCRPACDEGYFLSRPSACDRHAGFTAGTCEGPYVGTTSGHRYWVPNGGPGLGGKVFDVDPTSPGNGPPVTGTFYPSKRLACMFTCPLIVTNASDSPSDSSNATNPNSTSGSYVDRSAYHASLRRAEEGFAVDASSFTGGNVSVSSFALTRGVASDAATVSAKTAARWIDYTRIACVSPPRPTPSSSTRTLGDGVVVAVDASRNCVVTVTNDGDVFDDYYANGGPIGGSRDANATAMPNAAAVPFRYVGDVPTVTSISSRHGVRPEALARLGLPPARGPFAGGTTVTVRGDGFLPGDNLRCRFEDDVTGLPPFVADATWVDDHTVTCVTPRRSPRKTTRSPGDGADPYPGDGTDPRASLEVAYDANAMNDTIAPCFIANVSVSNDGVAFSDASSDGAEFLYCDVYASARTTADPTSYPYVTDPSTLAGTPNAPFTDLQSALHAALRGARVDVADGRTDRASTVRRSRGLVPRSARWLDKDVVRLAPGVYRGEGNVLLALDAQLVDVVAGDVDDWPDVERGGDGRVGPNAAVDCREVSLSRGNKRAGGSLRLFASQRVQVGGTPTVKPDGTGTIAGDGAVAFRGVSLEGCFDDAGAGESFADEGASCPAMEGRVSGGCRGDAHYVAPELPGHASGGYATDPDVWETWEYEDEDARYSNEAAWYDYEA